MKPARGSERRSTQGPGNRSKKGKGAACLTDKNGVKHQHVEKQKKAPRSAKMLKSNSGKGWKPLALSITSAVDRMLGLSVLTALSMKLKEKEETQRHLNILKESFLSTCSQLTVPPRKQIDLGLVSRQYQAESIRASEGEKRLKALTENHRSIVSTLEETEVTRDRLDEEYRLMSSKMEEQEDNSREVLQRRDQTILHLPSLTPQLDTEPLLQERLMKSLPNKDAVARALQNLANIQDGNKLLGYPHKCAG